MNVEDTTIVLDCYRLARFYHQSPEAFLAMPLSEVETHMMRTAELARQMRQDAQADDDG